MVFWIQFSFFVKGHNDSFLRDFIYFGFSSNTKRFFFSAVTETDTISPAPFIHVYDYYMFESLRALIYQHIFRNQKE